MTVEMHQIGEVAETVGLSIRTIRYYEEAVLVIPSGRSAGGFRLYTDTDIDRLRLVKDLKPLDLTIDEMRDLLCTQDRLAESGLTKTERTRLTQHLSTYATLARERCEHLRQRLATAEAVSRTLSREAQRRA